MTSNTPEGTARAVGAKTHFAIAEDKQVKGRVVTNFDIVSTGGFAVVQTIDGTTTFYQEFATRLEAAEEYALRRAHGRRNLHNYLASIHTDIYGSDLRPQAVYDADRS